MRFTLAIALLVGLSCTPAGPPTEDRPIIEQLAAGSFLPDDWLDLPQIESLRVARDAPFDPGLALAMDAGWSEPEHWGAWGLGARSAVYLHSRAGGELDLVLRVKAPQDPMARRQTVTVTVNDTPVGQFDAEPTWDTHRLALPAGAVRAGTNQVALAYAYHLDGIEGRDDRPLALALMHIGFVPRGTVVDKDEPLPWLKADVGRDALFLLHAGRYVVPYTVPPTADALTFDLRTVEAPGAPTPSLRISALTLDGAEHALPVDDTGGTRRTLDLDAVRGRRVLLIFDAVLPPRTAGARIEVRTPVVRLRLADGASETPPVAEAGESRPDIVMIILDAARADHFGAYGYHRDTTPQLDRLAAESLVFRNVVAECPYTACSSPSFMSGLSFTRHGIVDKGQRLIDDVQTLAEGLRDAGYRTVGYTSNPNNARITGADQGFDEFYEIWRYVQGRARTHPGPLTDALVERIEQGFDDQPFFLFAHYVPPHEPYDPDPEHDLFGDPDYDGPVTGLLDQTRAIFFGELAVDAADAAELEALYDGNLRQVDAWLPKIFEAQRAAGRWDQTVVLVTSDHGEAFGEHGRFGHNTTLFREMLDVPLILRLPEGRQPAVDLEGLVSLTSVPPTLLGLVGREADPRVDAPDLLQPRDDRDRLIPLRTSNPVLPVLGAQSIRWKAMIRYHDDRVVGLYDLHEDPRETTDRSRERPLLFVGLLTMLRQDLEAGGGDQAGESELSPEDEEMLRSLGYV